MIDTKNIIIIGKLGSGKSALANVLSGSDEFKEDNSSLTKAWRAVDKEFEHEGVKYRVIDTVGLGDKALTKEELLDKFEEEIGVYVDEGISQIFFVMDKKIDREILSEFLWLNERLFDKKAFDYTTIIRTNFTNFRSKKECVRDIDELVNFFSNSKKEDEELNNKILKKEKVIHVDNPPVIFNDHSNHDKEIESNKRLRQKSRKKLLDFLNKFKEEVPYKPNLRKWLDENYPENEREDKTVLNVSKQELKGTLRLKGFTNLKRLNCSNNQLTSLDLSDCPNLIELDCSNNKFTNLNFLKLIEKLEQLNISNCSAKGSLKSLANLKNLEVLFITNTNLNEGLEYLPTSCKKLVCNSNPPTKIMEELDKNKCSEEDSYNKKYYNLDRWRKTDKQNNLTASAIPLERLFVIRSNIKKYINKWSEENENNWYEVSYWKNQQSVEKKKNILSKLEHPNDFSKQWLLTAGIQWVNRATSVVGGGLLLVGQSDTTDSNSQLYTQTGGLIAIVAPFIETVTSYINDQVYEAKQRRWDEFISDTANLLDNYHELLGIIEQIKVNELGEVNEALNELRKKTQIFLKRYDKDENRAIDISELIDEREALATDLSKDKEENNSSQLNNIVLAIKTLEGEVINCRQGVGGKKTENQNQEKLFEDNKLSQKEDYQTIDLVEYFEERMEISPKE